MVRLQSFFIALASVSRSVLSLPYVNHESLADDSFAVASAGLSNVNELGTEPIPQFKLAIGHLAEDQVFVKHLSMPCTS